MRIGSVWVEKRSTRRLVGIVTANTRTVRIQTVQRVYGCWVRQHRARVSCITIEDFRRRFKLLAQLPPPMHPNCRCVIQMVEV